LEIVEMNSFRGEKVKIGFVLESKRAFELEVKGIPDLCEDLGKERFEGAGPVCRNRRGRVCGGEMDRGTPFRISRLGT
jgi:hypothetical protein